jgi:hypothetical protein
MYKIFAHKRAGDDVHYKIFENRRAGGCCTKYSKIAGAVQYLQNTLGARKLYLKWTRGRLCKIFFKKNIEISLHTETLMLIHTIIGIYLVIQNLQYTIHFFLKILYEVTPRPVESVQRASNNSVSAGAHFHPPDK